MFYSEKAELLTKDRVSDGMGGWIEGVEVTLKEIKVASAPVSAEIALKEYGVVTTSSKKLYTEDSLPETNFYINHTGKNYRILQTMDYGLEKILLVELM